MYLCLSVTSFRLNLCIFYACLWHASLMVPSLQRTRRIEDIGRLENSPEI